MTIIFDKNKALQNRERIREQVKKENRRRTIKNLFSNMLTPCLCAASVIVVLFSRYNMTIGTVFFASAVLLGFIVPSLIRALKENIANTVFPDSQYSPDVQYLIAIKGKNAFDYHLIEHDNHADLSFSLQNREGKVERAYIRGFKKKTSEKVKEVTINLETSIVYIPSL